MPSLDRITTLRDFYRFTTLSRTSLFDGFSAGCAGLVHRAYLISIRGARSVVDSVEPDPGDTGLVLPPAQTPVVTAACGGHGRRFASGIARLPGCADSVISPPSWLVSCCMRT